MAGKPVRSNNILHLEAFYFGCVAALCGRPACAPKEYTVFGSVLFWMSYSVIWPADPCAQITYSIWRCSILDALQRCVTGRPVRRNNISSWRCLFWMRCGVVWPAGPCAQITYSIWRCSILDVLQRCVASRPVRPNNILQLAVFHFGCALAVCARIGFALSRNKILERCRAVFFLNWNC